MQRNVTDILMKFECAQMEKRGSQERKMKGLTEEQLSQIV